ncbi:MAG: AI-2E family transporter [Gammaproteobacteria bacterium]|nr:AI-2E family transporter [Gammaproteobacteria bacterium]
MNATNHISSLTRSLIAVAAVVVIIGGVKSASDLLSPLLMAVFISIVCTPPLFMMQRRGVPTIIALIIILGFVGLCGVAVFSLITGSIDQFSQSHLRYKSNLTQIYQQLSATLIQLGIPLNLDILFQKINPNSFLALFNYLLNALSKLLADGMIVFLTVLFILAEVATLPIKLRSALKSPDSSMPHLQTFTKKVIHYLALKTATGVLTGACVALLLWVLNIDYIFLWAVLAFALNFIPYVGSVLAGLPPVVLGLIDSGIVTALWATAGYVTINIVVGNIIETRWMGEGLNLSSFVVFVSLIFWGWVLGPTGMFLSIPLTMLITIGLESNPETRRIAEFMQNST